MVMKIFSNNSEAMAYADMARKAGYNASIIARYSVYCQPKRRKGKK